MGTAALKGAHYDTDPSLFSPSSPAADAPTAVAL
jgi:hypothetical protein